MKTRLLLPVLAVACAGLRLAAAETRAPATASFEAFRLIGDRNIFDPTRAPRSARTADDVPRGDTLALVGTMHYAKGVFAFFDGSAPAFRKALREGETVADFTVTRIDQRGVELTRNAQKLPLLIGQQLQRPAGGDWAATAVETPRESAPAPAATDGAAPASADSTPPPPGASDVLKRLMEQRQKQLKP